MLHDITPIILTLDEEPNIGRCLENLTWARDVVVVDSLSSDRTREIATSFRNVRFFERAFDTHGRQWTFAVHKTGVGSEWVLALDADYMLTEEFVGEIASLKPVETVAGYRCPFLYFVLGEPLRASLYPPVTVLFRRTRSRYVQDGHTQRVVVEGGVEKLERPIVHDDRKDLSRWLANQERYMRAEAQKIVSTSWSNLSWPDRVRRTIVFAPALVFLYLLFFRVLILDGKRGVYYAMQRTLAEILLGVQILERKVMTGSAPTKRDAIARPENDDSA